MRKPHSQKELDNLKRRNCYTSETGRLAQANSVVAQKQLKTIAKIAFFITRTRIEDEGLRENLAGLGIPEEKMVYGTLIAAAVFQKAVKGSLPALEKWEEWMAFQWE